MSAMRNVQSNLNHVFYTATPVMRRLLQEESGQDLIEYALVFTLVALGAIASMKSLSTSVAKVFTTVGTTLTTST